MLNKLLFLSVGLAFLGSLTAHADIYGSAGIGVSLNDGSVTRQQIETAYENSPVYSLAVGYELPIPIIDIRGEIEYLHVQPSVKQGADIRFDGAFANAYVDIPLVPIVDPYIGGGIGYARFDHKNTTALQGMVGIEYEVPIIPFAIGGEYRYMKVNETGGKWDSPSKFHSNIFMIKGRYTF